MANDPKVQQLERQLVWNSPGPLGDIAAASVDSALSITGQMQADGRIERKGVYTPDEAVPFRAYIDELAARGVRIEEL